MTAAELKVVLDKHRKWLDGAPGGERADLREANLRDADLSGAKYNAETMWPAPSMVLLARWGEVSDQLCADLMAHDAANHPEPKVFDIWAKGGPCPYTGINVQRVANFQEKKELWGKGIAHHALPLMARLLQEKCIKE